MRFKRLFRKLYVSSVQHRCPECERGIMFIHHFRMRETCAYCGVRFFRDPGDAIGAVYINIAVTELSAVAGFFLVHRAFHPPMMLQLLFWIPYVVIVSIWLYPFARGLWVAFLYLTGGVYADPDYEREYIAPYYQAKEEEIGGN